MSVGITATQLTRRRLGLRFELRAPIAEGLELAVRSLIQLTLDPGFMMRPPKSFAVTLAYR